MTVRELINRLLDYPMDDKVLAYDPEISTGEAGRTIRFVTTMHCEEGTRYAAVVLDDLL